MTDGELRAWAEGIIAADPGGKSHITVAVAPAVLRVLDVNAANLDINAIIVRQNMQLKLDLAAASEGVFREPVIVENPALDAPQEQTKPIYRPLAAVLDELDLAAQFCEQIYGSTVLEVGPVFEVMQKTNPEPKS